MNGTVAHQTLDLLRNRRSVTAKNLTEPGPSEEQLKTIIEAGLRVPDHGKLGPWRILTLDKSAQATLGDVFAKLFAEAYPEATEAQIAFERDRPQRAPCLIIVMSTPIDNGRIPIIEQTLSAGAVCQNMLLAAHASGFAAQWLSEWPAYNAEVRATLGFGEDAEIAGMIYIGTPTEPPKERGRPAYEAVVSAWNGPSNKG